MTEYALLIAGQFQELRSFEEQPSDIPHKNVEWLPVERKTGATAGAEKKNGKWVITSAPAPVPVREASAGLFRQALAALNKLDAFAAALDAVPAATRAWLEYEPTLRETDPEVDAICTAINIDVAACFDAVDTVRASRVQ